MRVLVLGAGFGGLELTTRLSEELGEQADVTLIDKAEGFVFGYSKLDAMFGHASPDSIRHHYADLVKPGVTFVAATVTAIDPVARRVQTDAGTYEADVLVVALGADVDPAATPGLVEAGQEFYSVAGALAAGQALNAFEGGRVIVGVTSTPFKCPPAPSETALLVHDFLTARGLRERSEITLVMPLGAPIPPSPEASATLLRTFAERGIGWRPSSLIRSLDAERSVAVLADGDEIGFELFLGVPRHRAPQVVLDSGLAVDGWIPVDPVTLATTYPDVYAVGDVTSVGTPKAGVFAERQAGVVADRIVAQVRGDAPDAGYDGRGICYLEFGTDQVAKVDVTFRSGSAPAGTFAGPSAAYAADKAEFGSSRIRRWFGRDWIAKAGVWKVGV